MWYQLMIENRQSAFSGYTGLNRFISMIWHFPVKRLLAKNQTLPRDFTRTLHKFLSPGIADIHETVVLSGQMLDAGYLMLDIQQYTNDSIQ
jgi:hypothetical protein